MVTTLVGCHQTTAGPPNPFNPSTRSQVISGGTRQSHKGATPGGTRLRCLTRHRAALERASIGSGHVDYRIHEYAPTVESRYNANRSPGWVEDGKE